MARDLTAALSTAIQATTIRPAIAFEGEFETGWVRVWSGIGDKSINGNTYTGIGYLGAITDIEETDEVKAAGVTVQLSGVPSDMISLALQSVQQNKTGRLWLVLFDGESDTLVADPYRIFEGRLDVAEIEEGAETATVRLMYENVLVDLEKPRERRYTFEDQQLEYPGDRGFEYMNLLQDHQITWGRAASG